MGIDYKNYHRDEEYLKNENLFRNIFQKRLEVITKHAKKGIVLDIGCSNGVFLDLFKEAGWQTWGVEPSSTASVAKNKGHKIFNKSFESLELPRKYFDLVIMNHTLEHMDNPKIVLKKVITILKSDGAIYIDVPNAGGLGSKLLGKHWPLRLPAEHKWQFTKHSLTKLLKETGFRVIHFESRSGIFEYANPLLELHRKRFLLDVIAFPLSLVATLLNMGDSMTIIGRKK